MNATDFKASTDPRQSERLMFWLESFADAEQQSDALHCRKLVKLAVNAGLLTQGEALAFYKRAKECQQ